MIEGLTIRRRSADATDYYLSPRIVIGAPSRTTAGDDQRRASRSRRCTLPSTAALLRHPAAHPKRRYSPVGVPPRERAATRAPGNPPPGVGRGRQQRAARRGGSWRSGFPADRVFRAPHATRIEPFWHVAERSPPGTRRTPSLALGWTPDSASRAATGCSARVAQARRDGADAHLTVVGTGPEEARLQALAGELGVPSRGVASSTSPTSRVFTPTPTRSRSRRWTIRSGWCCSRRPRRDFR